MVVLRGVGLEFERGDDFAEKQPWAELGVDEHGALALPADAGALRQRLLQDGAGVDVDFGLLARGPDFFRERTRELGQYIGVYADSNLIAMAGERMAVDGLQEISGVVTHPEYLGQGHARRLTHELLYRHRLRGISSFLHVSEANTRALSLYESMGFVARTAFVLAKFERSEQTAK